jgi:hypothetical protein
MPKNKILLFGLTSGLMTLMTLGLNASAQSTPSPQSRLFECGDGRVHYLHTIFHGTNQVVSLVESVPGEGFSASQAGIFIEGISGGITVNQSISYRVKPLNNGGKSALNCAQGPLIRNDGVSAGVPFKALNSPAGDPTVTGPDADGYFTVTYTVTAQNNTFFNNLALIATNGGRFLITDFKLDGVTVPLDLKAPLLCPLGTSLTGLSPNQYCGP